MAQIRWRSGEFSEVKEGYEEAANRLHAALMASETLVLTLVAGDMEITINPAAIEFVRP
jgi:hypothetical protein